MRVRLLLPCYLLLVAVLVTLATPLLMLSVDRETQRAYLRCLDAADRVAALAQPVLLGADAGALRAALAAQGDGVTATVLRLDGTSLIAGEHGHTLRPDVRDLVGRAYTGQRGGPEVGRWPWQDNRLVVVEPVRNGADVLGVVVLETALTERDSRTLVRLGAVVASATGVLAGGWLLAAPLSRWLLRPVDALDQAAQEIARGRLDRRVPLVDGPPQLRRLAESINLVVETAAGVVGRQRGFLEHATHHVRNGLTALRLRVDTLPTESDPAFAAQRQDTVAEVERLQRLCDALLALARCYVAPGERVPVDLLAAAGAAVVAWRDRTGRHAVRIDVTGRPAIVSVQAETVPRIVDELLDNAVAFGGEQTRVRIDVRRAGDRALLVVRDDGPGLDTGHHKLAVTPFWRGPWHEDIDGSGLGLSTVDALVAAEGGRLRLSPSDPTGLTVTIDLPCVGEAP